METCKTGPVASIALCLLILAGIGFGAHPASAQETCPRTPGVTPISAPSVTAQQAESDPSRLGDFARAARAQFKSVSGQSVQQAYYFGCLIRQEGEAWRSGSTYLVQLTADGRVLVHAGDMSLSGRLLNRAIFATILLRLGVSQADLTNPTAIISQLQTEPDRSFDATTPIPNVRPGIPGATGHAAAYVTVRRPGSPIILLAGFDLKASHVTQEEVDDGNPAITARDVVDRATLKAFVTQAGEYFGELRRAGGRDAFTQAKAALRDPNGPWRHGSVYLYVLDTASNIILFHGAFPDRFELRPLVPTVRDVVTGELILPQVLDAAKNNPEGGFIQYYFDDPTDATDSADIPKIGYAREFKIRNADGSLSPDSVIIGSGFYLSDPGVIAHRQNLAIETIQPQVMRAMTASTVDAVSNRIERAIADDASQVAGLNFGGASNLSDALLAHGQSLESGTFDLGQLLAGASFTLPLNATSTGSGLFRNATIWGSGDYRDFDGGNSQTLNYEGDVTSINFGIDSRVGADMLAGFSVSRAEAEVDYDDISGSSGESTTTLISVNPYVGWRVDHCINVWATAGYGWGDIEINDTAAATQESDLEQQMVAAGVSGLLVDSDEVIQGGTTTVRIKAEAAYTWADTDGEGALKGLTLNASRSRLLLEAVHEQALESGGTLNSSLEVGVRHDGGDGEDGEGFETGAGLRFSDPATGVTFEGRARALLGHNGDYDEWGISGLVRIDPGADGVGLAVSIEPQWGQTTSGVQRMWEADAIGMTLSGDRSPLHMNARVAYGMIALLGGRQGVLTPYTNMSLSGEGSRRLSMGGQFNVGTSVQISMEILHDQPAYGGSVHGIMLHSSFNW